MEETESIIMVVFLNVLQYPSIHQSGTSLHCMVLVWFLNDGDLSRRRNAVLAFKEAVS